MRQGLLQVVFLLVGVGLTANAVAQDHTNENLGLAFKFQPNEFLLQPQLSSTLDNSNNSETSYRLIQPDSQIRTYDAILYYPLNHRGVSIDLGVNLRLQEDHSAQTDQVYRNDRDWLNINPAETQTLIHAAAVFDLPYSGFKAGLSGTYKADLAESGYDYRAKLSYKWKNGFGMEGGWQHQQKTYDQLNAADTLDVQTLFLDMNFRF